jgi:LacI family transcriptional regulator, repressor for deo operon, udp, cdd, tsx, nupC, and nupG
LPDEPETAVAVTLSDVARRAGVSPRTVSNVVNNFPFVADGTRARVNRVIEELGYRPNLVARNLRRGRSGVLALAIPDLTVAYFSEMASVVIGEAARHSYTVVIEQTDGRLDQERGLLELNTRALLADGLIFTPIALADSELRERQNDTPIVVLGERVFAGTYDHVGIDYVEAAREAVEHLVRLGRRRIAVIGYQYQSDSLAESGPFKVRQFRAEGYRQALAAHGMPVEPALLARTSSYRRRNGAEAMASLLELEEPPDAIFCGNDLVAMGAMHVIAERGLRIPEDIAVVGFDDIEEARYSNPTLTTISPDKHQIASAAVGQVLARMNGDRSAAANIQVPFHLEIRESTVGRARSPLSPPTRTRPAARQKR